MSCRDPTDCLPDIKGGGPDLGDKADMSLSGCPDDVGRIGDGIGDRIPLFD